jgi:hypothetical protein
MGKALWICPPAGACGTVCACTPLKGKAARASQDLRVTSNMA